MGAAHFFHDVARSAYVVGLVILSAFFVGAVIRNGVRAFRGQVSWVEVGVVMALTLAADAIGKAL